MGGLPVAFVSHGAPLSLEDSAWVENLGRWGKSLGEVRSILVVSAHWVTKSLKMGPLRPVPLIYDFWGFPDRFYRMTYGSPAAPDLGDRLSSLIGAGKLLSDPDRGLDHGMWVPLRGMFPEARIPVLGLSLPDLSPQGLYHLGKLLAPLRHEGVLLLSSGGMTHNLSELDPDRLSAPLPWASDFDQWMAKALVKKDIEALCQFESRAPYAHRSHPSTEHLAPLFVALGAAEGYIRASFPVTGFQWGSLSLRSVQFDG